MDIKKIDHSEVGIEYETGLSGNTTLKEVREWMQAKGLNEITRIMFWKDKILVKWK